MAYMRRLGADEGTILMGCSICGNAFRWPEEIRRCTDGLFRCNVFCTETETRLDYERKQGQSRKQHANETTVPFPLGPRPTGHES